MNRNPENFPILLLFLILGLSQFFGCGRDQGDSPRSATDSEPTIPVTVTQAVAKEVTIFIPMGLGIGGKSRVWGPMANTIIWGLSFATILALFFIPAFYAIMDDLVRRFLKIHE